MNGTDPKRKSFGWYDKGHKMVNRVLAIDPHVNRYAYALIEDGRPVSVGTGDLFAIRALITSSKWKAGEPLIVCEDQFYVHNFRSIKGLVRATGEIQAIARLYEKPFELLNPAVWLAQYQPPKDRKTRDDYFMHLAGLLGRVATIDEACAVLMGMYRAHT